tara:strand:+ start:1567 stop:2721 length:1155 start_codon:yes stop_codon:yes gene_type:complete
MASQIENIEDDWLSFLENTKVGNISLNTDDTHATSIEKETTEQIFPKCSPIYISTKTMISYLNTPIDYLSVFWKIPVISYSDSREGIIKKQIKITNLSPEETENMEKNLETTKKENSNLIICKDKISSVRNANSGKVKYKDVYKLSVGLSSKDIISHRCKKKGAFYNCFVMIMRIKMDSVFKEIHVKVFNTGKLQIPGVQSEEMLTKILDMVVSVMKPYVSKDLAYKGETSETELINSNFKSNYFINRDKLYNLLKYKYKIHSMFDPCSYPGIQCKFYYNSNYSENTGVCQCKDKKCNYRNKKDKKDDGCYEISFMIFRTGSVLIVGKCNEDVLRNTYQFIVDLLVNEYDEIHIPNSISKDFQNEEKKKKLSKKVQLKFITDVK